MEQCVLPVFSKSIVERHCNQDRENYLVSPKPVWWLAADVIMCFLALLIVSRVRVEGMCFGPANQTILELAVSLWCEHSPITFRSTVDNAVRCEQTGGCRCVMEYFQENVNSHHTCYYSDIPGTGVSSVTLLPYLSITIPCIGVPGTFHKPLARDFCWRKIKSYLYVL